MIHSIRSASQPRHLMIAAALRRASARSVICCLIVLASATASLAEDRTIDGSGNNLTNPEWGASFTTLRRVAAPAYADGISMPAGDDRPNPRAISNAVCDQAGESLMNPKMLSDWVWQWGQFIDHDITLSEFMLPPEPFDIPVPAGDVMFDPAGTGTAVMHLNRSVYDPSSGNDPANPRQQINQLTAFIDGSAVYGSEDDRAAWLRTGRRGKLKTSPGDLLPFSDGTIGNAGPGGLPSLDTNLFTAGDIRANEQAGLTAVHTLFVREHNRLCDELAIEHPDWSDEEIYQRARKIVGAIIQVITYHEFLPALLGPHAPDPADAVYDPNVDPRIANEFANVCYRIGHTMLSPQIMRMDAERQPMPEGPLTLRDAFFNPSLITDQGGIEPILMGLASQPMQRLDHMIVDDVRNFLFGQPGQGGFDLASLNIQRARDHGIPDYNSVREAFGLARKTRFAEVTKDPDVRARLYSVYDNVDQIDPWVGGISEDPLPGSNLGELMTTVIADQFTRLRDGDRFWYANDPEFTTQEIAELEATRLAHVIRRNTPLDDMQDDVFTARMTQPAEPDDGGGPLCGMMGAINWIFLLSAFASLRLLGHRRSRR